MPTKLRADKMREQGLRFLASLKTDCETDETMGFDLLKDAAYWYQHCGARECARALSQELVLRYELRAATILIGAPGQPKAAIKAISLYKKALLCTLCPRGEEALQPWLVKQLNLHYKIVQLMDSLDSKQAHSEIDHYLKDQKVVDLIDRLKLGEQQTRFVALFGPYCPSEFFLGARQLVPEDLAAALEVDDPVVELETPIRLKPCP